MATKILPIPAGLDDIVYPDDGHVTVWLKVYDVLPTMNCVLSIFGLGYYHTSVQVRGREYSFFGHGGPESGIFVGPNGHCFGTDILNLKETFIIGETDKTQPEIDVLITEWSQIYTGLAYNVFFRNGNESSLSFARFLFLYPEYHLPSWINRVVSSRFLRVIALRLLPVRALERRLIKTLIPAHAAV